MSTVTRVNFEPVRDVLPVQRAVFPLADPDLADPFNAVALVDGEWMVVDSNYKLARATDVASADDLATQGSWPHWNERGRSDMLSTGERRTVVLWIGGWEFDTRIFDATKATGTGAAITAVHQPLKVQTISIGGRAYSGIVGHGGSGDAAPIVGYVTRLPASNGGKLRMRGGMLY